MADLVIRGMEMPESCDKCSLFNECWCMALGIENWRKSYNKPEQGERLPDCPLVPLPEGHGRLIDADALMNNIGDVPYKGAVRRVLMSAPTIIEADLEWKMKNCCCFSNTDHAEGGGEDG